MNRPFAVSLLLGAALFQTRAQAQPNVAPEPKTFKPTFSLAELEQFLGGRTLLGVDVKDATLAEVAAAMAQVSKQKIVSRRARESPLPRRQGATVSFAPPKLLTLQSAPKPFWQALRDMQLQARREAEAANALPGSEQGLPPNSVALQKIDDGWMLDLGADLVRGRAVATWPLLILATDIQRSQNAVLSEEGLEESANRPIRGLGIGFPGAGQPVAPAAPVPTAPAPEIERWRDQLTLSGQIFFDPKINVANLHCEVLEAIDDLGNDLRLPKNDSMGSFGGALSSAARRLQISLKSKPIMGKRLVKLRGEVRFNVVTRSQHWETTQFDTPIGATVFRDGGEFDVQFKGLEKTANGWSANFTSQSKGAHLQSLWEDYVASGRRIGFLLSGWSVLSFNGAGGVKVIDANGEVFQTGGSGRGMTSWRRGGTPNPVAFSNGSLAPPDLTRNWSLDEERGLSFGSRYDEVTGRTISLERPVKLILDLPIERREVIVPFEFTDLPLPPS